MSTQKESNMSYLESHCTTEELVRKTMEECGELIQAANKWYENQTDPKAWSNLASELADVSVCIEHMTNLADVPAEYLKAEILAKIDRACDRIREREESEE